VEKAWANRVQWEERKRVEIRIEEGKQNTTTGKTATLVIVKPDEKEGGSK